VPETVEAKFNIDSWDEKPFDEVPDASKLTRASVTKSYSGDIEGTSTTEWLMSYAADGSATFVGLERIVGKVGDHKGSIVLRHVGTFTDGAATAKLQVVKGAGSDDLANATGDGDFTADPAGSVTLRLRRSRTRPKT
jgi:Protein of unknown function (DUF3224)